MIVERIEALARAEAAITRLVLETGDRHPAAWTVYERAGFTAAARCSTIPIPKWSVFYERRSSPSSAPLA